MDDATQSGVTRIGAELIDHMLRRFAGGELDRKLVMDRLDLTYSELLQLLHQRGLHLPLAPEGQRAAMAGALDRMLDGAHD